MQQHPFGLGDRARLEGALPQLAKTLSDVLPAAGEGLSIERQFDAGQSNPTYLFQIGGGRYVLRKQPYGALMPRAHDVVREHDIMRALSTQGFAVPRPVIAVDDRNVIGTSFFVMEFIPGVVESNPALPDRPRHERAPVYRSIAETLAELHRIDPAILESANVRYRPDFVGRQIKTWSGQYAASLTEPDDRVDLLAKWLMDNRPAESRPAIVHGDYRIENLILRETSVAAVLDWELCAIGEPLCDLSYCCIWYHLPETILSGLSTVDLRLAGIPEESEFIDIYSSRSGIDGTRAHDYFMAFSFYRLAAIMQGVYKRGLEGNAASSQALTRGPMARLCLDKAEAFAGR